MTVWVLAAGWMLALATGAVARHVLLTRTEAVADACHELRGPLTSVRLGLELGARQGRLSDAQVRALELELDRAALALDDFSGPQRGRYFSGPQRRRHFSGPQRRRRQWVDLRAVVIDSVEAWRPAAPAGIEFAWHGAGAWVIGDRVRLAQATGNLIANAVEHGGGPIEVHGRFDAGVARIEVRDSGPGLPAPVAELTHRRRRAGGRGRGLSIVSAIASAHGGRLTAAPSPRGARLVLALPALPAPTLPWTRTSSTGQRSPTPRDPAGTR